MKIHVVGQENMLTNLHRMIIGGVVAQSIEEADLVIFTGGVDINPKIYGQKTNTYTQNCDTYRDLKEIKIFKFCVKNNIPMLGICRGAQLGAVLSGHSLVQHVNNHTAASHKIFFTDTRYEEVCITGDHHQMINLNMTNRNFNLIGYALNIANIFLGENDSPVTRPESIVHKEPEIVHFFDTNFLAIQAHPEWNGPDYHNILISNLVWQYLKPIPTKSNLTVVK